jgi:hypothetical protein
MSLLAAAMRKNPNFGYTPDFIQSMSMLLEQIKAKGIKVVTNAGGINVTACADALRKIAEEKGIDLNIATVTGDDLMSCVDKVRGMSPTDLGTGRPFPSSVSSINAYLGAYPIAHALDLKADVVITGRCVDSALVLGPLIHQYGWKPDDYDLLSSGSLAGHIIECGAQATGGVFTDWEDINGWDDIGFPIVECSSDGSFTVTKPPGTGGLVSFGTVAEQVVYEIGDPKRYVLPDVVCDWSEVELKEAENGVAVSGARGTPPSQKYKVSATYADGFRSTAVCALVGPKSDEKAMKTAESILKRTRRMFKALGMDDFTDVNLQVVGADSCYHGSMVTPINKDNIREVMVWIAVKHKDRRALELFSREIAPAGTGMAPGFTMMVGGRPKASPVLRLFSCLYPKENVKAEICLNGEVVEEYVDVKGIDTSSSSEPQEYCDFNDGETVPHISDAKEYKLSELAFLRSGDKGDTANIGVVARHPSLLPFIKRALTSKVFEEFFYHNVKGIKPIVERYDIPGISGLNFVLPQSLGGGGIASLNVDPQGKAYAQILADLKITIPSDVKVDSLAK